MKEKITKKGQVLKHLQEKRFITSLHAISLYGATRLADIIFKLREVGYNIKTEMKTSKDRNGQTVNFAKYIYNEK